MARLSKCIIAGAGLILSLACCGCNSNEYQTATVTGTVLCNGKPAVGGAVSFEPIDAPDKTGRPAGHAGRMSLGTVGEDGRFTLKILPGGGDAAVEGALIGPHRVSFHLPKTTPWEWNPSDNWMPKEEQDRIKADLASRPVYKPLACSANIAPGEVEVKPGMNEFEFTLQPGASSTPRPRFQQPTGSN